ncbi:MAG: hypothetical protein JW940_36010 [Polyangiaceae bacterium]|nr:hypothetical protein [Polyangiaceae bacterium]
MTNKTRSSAKRDSRLGRERLKQEIAVLKAIGATPERLLAARSERTVRQRVGPNHAATPVATVSDLSAVRALARQTRGAMQPHLDTARRTLLTQVKQPAPRSSTQQITESVELLQALRCFDPAGQQLEEAAESLAQWVHGDTPRHDTAGGTQRRDG